ncbi:MAG: hypothetical protein IKG42_05625 [Clostridia bacterium]|nr:hypothetical protein [Clostridia bacterium]
MEDKIQFRKNFIWNTIGTGLNAFNSLFFMIIVTRINGLNDAGVFTLAFSTANILFAVGLYSGRVYQVTELNKEISDNDFILSRIITILLMMILVLLFCFCNKYDINKAIVFILLTFYKSIDAFCDVLYGIMQKNEKLDVVGKSLIIKSILSLTSLIIVDIVTKNLVLSIISVVIVYIFVSIVYDFKKTYKFIKTNIKIKKKNIINILKNGFFIFSISFLGMYIVNAPKYSIDKYLCENYQTIFAIIVMPATIISLIAQFLIHPYLNKIIKLYKEKNLKDFKIILFKIIGVILCCGIIATIVGYFLGTFLLGIVYGINLENYKLALSIIIIASTLYTLGTVLSSILTTVRKIIPQFLIYIFITVFAYMVSDILTKVNSINGAIISYFAIMAVYSLLYALYVKINIKKIFKREGE